MFKIFPWALVVCAVSLSCESRPETAAKTVNDAPVASAAPTPKAPPAPSGSGVADTAAAFASLLPPGDSIRLGNQTYRVLTSVKTDPNHRLPLPAPVDSADSYTLPDSVALRSSYGYDVVFTIRLLGPTGKPRFTTTLHKTDFMPAMGSEHIAVSVSGPPTFCGYLPRFNALAFLVSFYLDETDDGGEALLLLDATTGKVRHIGPYAWADGGQGSAALTPDGRTLLTSQEIIHTNGQRVSLLQKNEEVAGTLLLNESTALAVYEDGYDAVTGKQVSIRGQNAHLLDLNGRELGRFRFHGTTTGGMGYALNQQYLAQTRIHYLFDETDNTLRVIPRAKPLGHRLIRLSQLPKFTAPQHPTEVRFSLNTDLGKQLTLYVDTTSGALRYQLFTPKYFED